MNLYRIKALVGDRRQIERDVEAQTVFGAVSLVTVDLWDDCREVTALTVWLLEDGCVMRSAH